MYVRVFESILDSSLNVQSVPPAARWLWITMLIIADQNRTGVVDMPVERLAARAGLTIQQTSDALALLGAPDPQSSTADEDGRRLVPIREDSSRGWRLVNWEKYRDIATAEQQREATRKRVREHRARVTLSNKVKRGSNASEAEASPTSPPASTTEAPSPEEETVTRTLGIVAPDLKASPEDVRGWLTMKPDPWWVSAVICENELHLRKKPSVPYLTKIIERRVRDDWKEDDLEGYVRYRWSKAS